MEIKEPTFAVPLIIRADQEGWIPTFDIWNTKITGNTSFIACPQRFGAQLKHYDHIPIDFFIGYYDKEDKLVINWKALIDSEDIDEVNAQYTGKLRACCWQKRYCTYFSMGSKTPWLHSVVSNPIEANQVIHHINGVSVDNRKQNLHILPKREHDGIDHPKLEERMKMFEEPALYWQQRKKLAIDNFIIQLSLIVLDEYRANYIGNFAAENPALAREILSAAKMYINLNNVKSRISTNRALNPHLPIDYLDTYEIEKHLKKSGSKVKSLRNDNQLRFF